MPFIDLNAQIPKEIWPGIHATFGHSDNITIGRVKLDKGAVVDQHQHPHEQWTIVIEGEFEFTINGETKMLSPGMVAHMPSSVPHSARAITPVVVIDCFTPAREDFKVL